MIKYIWTIDRVLSPYVLLTNIFILADIWQPWRARRWKCAPLSYPGLEGVAASKALWLALLAKRLIWAVRAQKLLERELPFSKYMFLRHLSSLYRLEVILSDAFDSEHTSYYIIFLLISLLRFWAGRLAPNFQLRTISTSSLWENFPLMIST